MTERLPPLTLFLVFLRLGLTSFGGPVAHLGYFREALVVRRRWIDDATYAEFVALCGFLPGPTSSQVGFAIGLTKGGYAGAAAAFVGFTAPSVMLLLALAGSSTLLEGPAFTGALQALKLVAVAVVADALRGMVRTLAPDPARATVAVAAAAAVLLLGPSGQLAAIALGGVAGVLALPTPAFPPMTLPARVSPRAGAAAFALAGVLLAGALLTSAGGTPGLLAAFYRAGALVFGGGHVVLPLLDASLVDRGWLSEDAFLAGYAAAQAVPGPLFSVAGYYGSLASVGPGGVAGALLAVAALFLPGFLLVIGVLPLWRRLGGSPTLRAAMAGLNAAVVGLLGAALYDPIFLSAVHGPAHAAWALAAFLAIAVWRVPPVLVVLVAALAGTVVGLSAG